MHSLMRTHTHTTEAGDAFRQAAELHMKLDTKHEAATHLVEAGQVMKKEIPHGRKLILTSVSQNHGNLANACTCADPMLRSEMSSIFVGVKCSIYSQSTPYCDYFKGASPKFC